MNVWSFIFADPAHPWQSARVAAATREEAHLSIGLAVVQYAIMNSIELNHDPRNEMIVVSHLGQMRCDSAHVISIEERKSP